MFAILTAHAWWLKIQRRNANNDGWFVLFAVMKTPAQTGVFHCRVDLPKRLELYREGSSDRAGCALLQRVVVDRSRIAGHEAVGADRAPVLGAGNVVEVELKLELIEGPTSSTW